MAELGTCIIDAQPPARLLTLLDPVEFDMPNAVVHFPLQLGAMHGLSGIPLMERYVLHQELAATSCR